MPTNFPQSGHAEPVLNSGRERYIMLGMKMTINTACMILLNDILFLCRKTTPRKYGAKTMEM